VSDDENPANTAVTLLHELELHVLHAARMVQQLETLKSGLPNVNDLVALVFEFMDKPDDHANLERLEAFLRAAALIKTAMADTAWASWAEGVFQYAANDAITQLAAAEIKSGASEESLAKVNYLKALSQSLGGNEVEVPQKPKSKELGGSGKENVKTQQKIFDVQHITALIGTAVALKTPFRKIVSEMAELYGIQPEMTIDIYNNAIVPELYRKLPAGNLDETIDAMQQYGVPLTIIVTLLEKKKPEKPTLPYSYVPIEEKMEVEEDRQTTGYSSKKSEKEKSESKSKGSGRRGDLARPLDPRALSIDNLQYFQDFLPDTLSAVTRLNGYQTGALYKRFGGDPTGNRVNIGGVTFTIVKAQNKTISTNYNPEGLILGFKVYQGRGG